MLKHFLADYFGCNKQQRNGILVLLFISLCVVLIRGLFPLFIKPDPIVLLDLPLIEQRLNTAYPHNPSFSETTHILQEKNTKLFMFNPNTINYDQLLQLGLSAKTATVFLKFRNNGFVFKEKKDLLKVYGISDKLYAQLEAYIFIEPVIQKSHAAAQEKEKQLLIPSEKVQPFIELNTADTLALLRVKGIGNTYAKRILKYRHVLGGYTRVEQLKEVYGMTEEHYEIIKNQVYTNAANLQKLNLNKDDFKMLNKHPYLSYEKTKVIFEWRRKTNISPANIREVLNDDVLYQKLNPYLTFD